MNNASNIKRVFKPKRFKYGLKVLLLTYKNRVSFFWYIIFILVSKKLIQHTSLSPPKHNVQKTMSVNIQMWFFLCYFSTELVVSQSCRGPPLSLN